MIGTYVRWAKVIDGRPTTDLEGEVIASGLDGSTFRVLVRQKDGALKSAEARDLVVVASKPEIAEVEDVGEAMARADRAQLRQIAETARELGLGVELNFGIKSIGDGASDLIRELARELVAAGEQANKSEQKIIELEAQVAKLKAKPPKTPKPDPAP